MTNQEIVAELEEFAHRVPVLVAYDEDNIFIRAAKALRAADASQLPLTPEEAREQYLRTVEGMNPSKRLQRAVEKVRADFVGNDGLTDAERDELAARHRATVAAPLTPRELRAIARWKQEKP